MSMKAIWCSPSDTNHIFMSVCMSIYFYLPVPYFGVPFSDFPSLVAAFSLPLGTNVIVTTLIAGRIWYLSPSDAQFPTQIGRAAIIIVVESCMLNLAAQIILAILYALGHPARFVVGIIVVQIYVRISHHVRPSFVVNHLPPKSYRASRRH